jgi:predicted Zn finger-like uncharacterized protein
MNNTCPSCGALYNVASKDIGRKIKCKKCNTALAVTDAGLVVDSPSAPAPVPAAVMEDEEGGDVVVKKKGSKYERAPGTGIDVLALIPTLVFGFGVFLVIVFSSLPRIGEAGTDRAFAYVEKLIIERDAKLDATVPKGKKYDDLTTEDQKKIDEEKKKIREDYKKLIDDAGVEAEKTGISNRRDVWLERYGLMFGFIFVSFGCIAFLRTEQPLVMRIVAGVILTIMMIIMFTSFTERDPPKSPNPKGPLVKPGFE